MKLNQLKEVFHAHSFMQKVGPWSNTAKWLSREQYETLSPDLQGFVEQYFQSLNKMYDEVRETLKYELAGNPYLEGWETHEHVTDTSGWDELPFGSGSFGKRTEHDKAYQVEWSYIDSLIDFMDDALREELF